MPAVKRELSSELSDASSPQPSESTPPLGPDTTSSKGKKPKRANTTTPTKTAKKIVKREEDGTNDDGTLTSTTPKRGSSGGGSGTAFGKARISADAKQTIASEIVLRGLASLDFDALERETGLSKSQIRSQLADNRRNLRHQLFDMIKGMQ